MAEQIAWLAWCFLGGCALVNIFVKPSHIEVAIFVGLTAAAIAKYAS